MGLRRFAYLFAHNSSALAPARLVDAVISSDLTLQREVLQAQRAGGKKRWEELPDSLARINSNTELKGLLHQPAPCLFQIEGLGVTVNCLSAASAESPHIVLFWEYEEFRKLEYKEQLHHRTTIKHLARQCGATYVVVADESAGCLEDSFPEVDGVRRLGFPSAEDDDFDVLEVWSDAGGSVQRPLGFTWRICFPALDGFDEFHQLTPSQS